MALSVAGIAPCADLADIKTVYMLPMSNGLDQYIAIRLTTGTSLQVVTDAQKADAVMTDRIGEAFEEKLNELYKPPVVKNSADAPSHEGSRAISPASRGKGAIFLVDRKTRNVLWSTYAVGKSAAPDDMNHLADKIVSKLGKDRRIK